MFLRGRLAAVVLVALGALIAGTVTAMFNTKAVYPGVRVAGVDLSGLTADQARDRLQSLASDAAAVQVILKYGEGRILRASMADLGGSVDLEANMWAAYRIGREGSVLRRVADIIAARRHGVDLPAAYRFDVERASEYLRSAAKTIDRKPINAGLVVENGEVRGVREKAGIRLDVEKSLQGIAHAVNSGVMEADLTVVTNAPKITSDDLRGIDGIIGSYSTSYKRWQRDRTHNLHIACAAINGTLLRPGEVFSYNKVVGPRSEENGYRNAPMFVRGQVEPGTGGGVCQVSTTLYNAALLADTRIVRRSHHSRPVAYAPAGRDATVAYPALDLKFENATGSTIYILAWVGDCNVNVQILGKKQKGREVDIMAVGHKVVAAPVVEEVDEGLQPGKHVVKNPGRPGRRVSIYRVVRIGGKVVRRELISNDYYSPEKRVVAMPAVEWM